MGKCKLLPRSIPWRVLQSPPTIGTIQKVMYLHSKMPSVLDLSIQGHADEYVHCTCVFESCHAWLQVCLSNCPPTPYDLVGSWRKQSYCSTRNFQENDGQHRQVYQRGSGLQGISNAFFLVLAETNTKLKWFTAFPQIVSRVGHSNPEVYKYLSQLIITVMEAYPKQALWLFMSVVKSTKENRQSRGRQILSQLGVCFNPPIQSLSNLLSTFLPE